MNCLPTEPFYSTWIGERESERYDVRQRTRDSSSILDKNIPKTGNEESQRFPIFGEGTTRRRDEIVGVPEIFTTRASNNDDDVGDILMTSQIKKTSRSQEGNDDVSSMIPVEALQFSGTNN